MVYQSPAARQDVVAHYVYLAENAGDAVAERFLGQLRTSLELIANQPGLGSPLRIRSPDLQGLRKWRVKDFDNVLVFYRPRQDGISVLRVLHASQDWWALLDLDN